MNKKGICSGACLSHTLSPAADADKTAARITADTRLCFTRA